MLNLKESRHMYLKGEDRAVLLLHSFTGTTRDVKDLAYNLNKQGFTCYVPAYKGHGLSIEAFLDYQIDDWWNQVLKSYQFLIDEGYEEINVLGVSLGGLFSLKLSEEKDINKSVIMSAPNKKDNNNIKRRIKSYGERMNYIQNLDENESKRQIALIDTYDEGATKFCDYIEDIMTNLNKIQNPISIKYGERDQQSYKESAEYIYEHVSSNEKTLTAYPNSSHLMTRSEDKDEIEENILAFLK